MPFRTHPPPVIWLTVLGIGSGILSSFKLGFLGELKIFDINLQQGLLFGAVIGFGIFRWGRAGWPGALLAMLTVLLAWMAAFKSFTFLTNAGLNTYPAGVAAGAIGAFGTILAGALTVPALRRRTAWLSTISIGAILGLLVIYATTGGDEYLLILFVPWQGLVAASIGYALETDPALAPSHP